MIWVLVATTILVTSFISGVLGMAGGMLLMGVLSLALPVVSAMILHGFTQMFSNGFRAYLHNENIQWKVMLPYLLGSLLSLALLSSIELAPSPSVVLIALGSFPFLAFALPKLVKLDIQRRHDAFVGGVVITLVQIIAGASGPVLDVFFIRSKLTKLQIIATKAMTQTLGHIFKLVFYTQLLFKTGGPELELPLWIYPLALVLVFVGTYLGKQVLIGLSELHFRKYSRWVIYGVGLFYIYQGLSL